MCMKWSVLVCESACYKDGFCFQLVLDVCEGLVPRRKMFWFVAVRWSVDKFISQV